MKRLKVILVLGLLFGATAGAVVTPAQEVAVSSGEVQETAEESLTTGAVVCVNNTALNADYKLTAEQYQDVCDKVRTYTTLKAVDKDETDSFRSSDLRHDLHGIEHTYQNSEETLNWLIKNNVYSRNSTVAKGSVSFRGSPPSDNSDARKSDFYMMLYKAKEGVIQPNLVYDVGTAYRAVTNGGTNPSTIFNGYLSEEDYWGEGINAEFTGDYFVYSCPNVYELYLAEMLDAGIISVDELSDDTGFKEEYLSGSGLWRVTADSSVSGLKDGVLGHSVRMNGCIEETSDVDYFRDESLRTLEALQSVARYLRQFENMSKVETDVIAYKYGLTDVYGIDDSYKNDIYYLVGMGILSFDDSDSSIDLDSEYLSQGQMYEIMYRVANVGARYDFTKVQLTDAETDLARLGYCQTDVSIFTPSVVPVCKVVSTNEVKPTQSAWMFWKPEIVDAADEKMYTVTMNFDATVGKDGPSTGNVYTYKSPNTKKVYVIGGKESESSLETAVGTLKYPTGESEIETTDFTTKELPTKTSSGKSLWGYQITFKVLASNSSSAQKKVLSRIGYRTKSKSVKLQGISKVTDSNGKVVTMIAQDSLKSLSEITVVADKILTNNKTGAQCLIQTSLTTKSDSSTSTAQGYALVGNQIIGGEDMLVTNQNDQIYYNLKMVQALLSNAALNDLGIGSKTSVDTSLIVSPTLYQSKAVYSFSRSGESLTRDFYYIRLTKNNKVCQEKSAKGKTALYSMSSLSKGLNTLSRTFSIKVVDPSTSKVVYKDFTFIVDWVYYAPVELDVASISTLAEYQQLVYTRPSLDTSSKAAARRTRLNQLYWDRNYGMSNALANMMYGTKGVVYVRSGYMVPKLTVLLPDTSKESQEFMRLTSDKQLLRRSPEESSGFKNAVWVALENFFEENFSIGDAYGEFLGGNLYGWWSYYYGGEKATKVGKSGMLSWMGNYSELTSTEVDKMTSYLEVIGAARMTVGYAKNSDEGTLYRTEGGSILAFLSKGGALYRNVSFPKGFVTKKNSLLTSFLSVSYKDREKALISSITVQSESDTNQGLKVSNKASEGDVVALPMTITQGDTKYVAAQYDGKVKAGTTSYVRFSGYVDPGVFTKNESIAKSKESPILVDSLQVSFMSKNGKSYVKCPNYGGSTKSYATRLDAIQSALLGKGVSIKSGITFKTGTDSTESALSSQTYSLANSSTIKAAINDNVVVSSKDVVTSKNLGYYRVSGTEEMYQGFYVFADGIYGVVWEEVSKGSNFFRATSMSSKLKAEDLEKIRNGQGSCILKIWPRFAIESTSFPNFVTKGNEKFWYPGYKGTYDYVLSKKKTYVAAQQNLYVAGLNESVIQSMLSVSTGIAKVSELKEGYTLEIGDTKWVKRADYWQSLPIVSGKSGVNGSKIVKAFQKGDKFYRERVYDSLGDLFNGVLISAGDSVTTLIGYVDPESVALGNGYRGTTSLRANQYTKGGILCRQSESSNLGVLKSRKSTGTAKNYLLGKTLDTSYKYVTLKMKFLEGTDTNPIELYARPLNLAGTSWALTYAGIGMLEGYDLALFNEEMNYSFDSTVDVEVDNSVYEMPDGFSLSKKEFKKEFMSTVASDTYTFLKWVTVLLTIWIFFMCWISFFVLHLGVGRQFFEAFSKPSRTGRSGVDFIRLATFNIFNLDSDPSLSRLVTVTAILIVIDVVIAYLL